MKKNVVYVLLAILAMAIGVAVVYCVKQGIDIKEVLSRLKPRTELAVDTDQPEESLSQVQESPIAPTPEESTAGHNVVAEGQPVETPAETPAETQAEILVTPHIEEVQVVPAEPQLSVDKSGCRVEQIAESGFMVSGLRAKNVKGSRLSYVLSDSEGHRYESTDGFFENVAPNEKGTYAVVVRDLDNGEKSKASIISGFKIVKPIEKLSAAELSAIFNTGSGDSLNSVQDKFARNCKVRSNRSEVSTMSKVFELVNMQDLRATVTDVEYDAVGRIVSFYVSFNE